MIMLPLSWNVIKPFNGIKKVLTAKSFSYKKYLAKNQEKLKHNTYFTEWICVFRKPFKTIFCTYSAL